MKLSNDTLLVIPSRERVRWLASRTNHTLRFVSHLEPFLYVRDDDSQFKEYEAYATAYGVNLWLQDSKNITGAAQTYDSLIEYAIKKSFKRLIILDDDVAFATFQPILGVKPDFPKVSGDLLTHLLTMWSDLLSPQMPAVSMNSILRRTQPELLSFSKPLTWCYAYYLPHFAKHPEHRFYKGPEIEAHCDLNISLRLLTDGFMVGLFNALIMVTQPNNPGGCSTYRDEECWRLSSEYLLRTYPEIVKSIPRKKVGGQAIRISWKRAFNYAAFKLNFDLDATPYFRRVLHDLESRYSCMIEDIRHAT